MNIKKLSIACGLAVVGLVATISAAFADPVRVTQTSNLFSGPGPNYGLLGSVPAGTVVDRQQCSAGNAWCYITQTSGPNGWIDGSRLAPNVVPPPSGGGAGVAAYTNGTVNLRSGPGTEYTPALARLEPYTIVRRLECTQDNTWCYITRTNGAPGWVSARYLTVGTPPPVDTPTPPPPGVTPETVVVLANVNLRSSASDGNNVIGSVPRGTVATRLECSANGQWCRVRLADGRTGWISAQYLGASVPDEPTPPPVTPEPPAGDLYQARVLLNVRNQPNGADVIGTLQPGQVVVRERCANAPNGSLWCFIRTERGNTGWVSAQFIEPARPGVAPPPTQPAPPPSGGQICFQGPLGNICISGN